MTENFKVVKNKYKILAAVASIALGVFCGVIVACSLLLAFKLSEIEIEWFYYLLIGIGVAACCSVPFYFILRPNDKKLALKLDKRYALNQKVQTMVEFAGESGALISMQREQTNEALAAAAKARPDFKGLIKFVFIPVVAIAIACVSILIPAKKTVEIQPAFALTDTQRRAVNGLIDDINSPKCELVDELKASTTAALRDMLAELEEIDLQSKMKSTAIRTIKNIDAMIAESNSYYSLYLSLKDDELTKPFAIAEALGVINYKNTSASTIKTLSAVNSQHSLSYDKISDLLPKWKDEVADTFYVVSDGNKQLMERQEIVDRVEAYSAAFKAGLEKVEFAGENDLLLTSIEQFTDNILAINVNFGASGYFGAFKEECSNLVTPSIKAISTQTYSCLMDEFIRNRTAEIFGLKKSDIGSNSNVVPEYIDSGSGSGGSGSGSGIGEGGSILGGNDTVLKPGTNDLVSYGSLMYEYKTMIETIIREYEEIANSEDATEEDKEMAKYALGELSKFMQQYFAILDGSNKE